MFFSRKDAREQRRKVSTLRLRSFASLRETLYACLVIPCMLNSCIVGTDVNIFNKSVTDKKIQVQYPPAFRFPLNHDSLPGYDLTKTEKALYIRDYYRYPVKIPIEILDTISRTYAFSLKAKHKVFIERNYPSATPAFEQIFIVDNRDTAVLKKKGSFRKRPKHGKGGSWTYIIN